MVGYSRRDRLWGIVFGQQASPPKPQKLNLVRLHADREPIDIFSTLKDKFETAFILESVEGPKRLTRYTFLGFDPKATIQYSEGHAEILDHRNPERRLETCKDPLELLSRFTIPIRPTPGFERYAGGLVGYASYNLAHSFEPTLKIKHRDHEFPDLQFGLFDDGILFDHIERKAYYFYQNENKVDRVRGLLQEPIEEEQISFGRPSVNLSQARFRENVKRAKEYIRSGDIFQVVLSKRYKIPFKGSLLRLYRALREINPSPYMYYLKFGDREIVGASPEMLARKIGRTAESFPIAGTRPYTADPARNRALAAELLSDEKEQAEHVMLVDLARNDLGKVCEYGTVRVPSFLRVQSYSHVQHIVSQVTGHLRRDATSFDLFRSVFPAGTVSGAPKPRALEIISELESTPRGPYAGAVGYFSNNGSADFAITIRTLTAQDGYCFLRSGSGIVADSVPEREWIETERKAAALFTAMDRSSRGQQ
ncbi:MAG TPA: anthranilate synthase component I family protein [Candidatus Bathyarchaeia archaeon]|nr:anthranilate synthase component I family protein [Candidatus Bathyarchaeia archaeon]